MADNPYTAPKPVERKPEDAAAAAQRASAGDAVNTTKAADSATAKIHVVSDPKAVARSIQFAKEYNITGLPWQPASTGAAQRASDHAPTKPGDAGGATSRPTRTDIPRSEPVPTGSAKSIWGDENAHRYSAEREHAADESIRKQTGLSADQLVLNSGAGPVAYSKVELRQALVNNGLMQKEPGDVASERRLSDSPARQMEWRAMTPEQAEGSRQQGIQQRAEEYRAKHPTSYDVVMADGQRLARSLDPTGQQGLFAGVWKTAFMAAGDSFEEASRKAALVDAVASLLPVAEKGGASKPFANTPAGNRPEAGQHPIDATTKEATPTEQASVIPGVKTTEQSAPGDFGAALKGSSHNGESGGSRTPGREGNTPESILRSLPPDMRTLPPDTRTAGRDGVLGGTTNVNEKGEQVTTLWGRIVEPARNAKGDIVRLGFEKDLATLPGVANYERAHLWAAAFGDEASAGIMHAPAEFNTSQQKIVENALRGMFEHRPAGGEVIVQARATSYPLRDYAGPVLQKVEYQFAVVDQSGRIVDRQGIVMTVDRPPSRNVVIEGQPHGFH